MTGVLINNDRQPMHSLNPALSIIVPMLNEIEQLPELLVHLQQWQRRGCEVLLVDGGSRDGSADEAEIIGLTVLRSSRGRARQMNMGAASAKGGALVFLHADTRLPAQADQQILEALSKRHWGRFDVRLTGEKWMLRIVAFLMNWRSRITGIATGDQAIFVEKSTFTAIGGFPDLPLMEDIEISKRLKQVGPPQCLSAAVVTSGRRWLENGVWSTIWLMWRLRWAYWRGQSAEQLNRLYR